MSLIGKVAIVTGGGRGIGAAASKALAGQGAAVAILARTASQTQQIADSIIRSDGRAMAIACDVSKEDQVVKAFHTIEHELGRIDIVVNNAGILNLQAITDISIEEWQQIMNVNLTGAFLVAREAFKQMAGVGGTIINVGSMAGRRGYADQGAYCASKHGLAGLTKVLSIEGQQHGIRVHLVSPGGVLTELSAELRDSRGTNEQEWMSADEVADAIIYCANQTGVAISDEIVLRRFASEPWR